MRVAPVQVGRDRNRYMLLLHGHFFVTQVRKFGEKLPWDVSEKLYVFIQFYHSVKRTKVSASIGITAVNNDF